MCPIRELEELTRLLRNRFHGADLDRHPEVDASAGLPFNSIRAPSPHPPRPSLPQRWSAVQRSPRSEGGERLQPPWPELTPDMRPSLIVDCHPLAQRTSRGPFEFGRICQLVALLYALLATLALWTLVRAPSGARLSPAACKWAALAQLPPSSWLPSLDAGAPSALLSAPRTLPHATPLPASC